MREACDRRSAQASAASVDGGVRCAMTIYVAHLMKASRTKSMVVEPSAKKAVAHLL